MNFKSMTKVYALPVILIIIAGMAFFVSGRGKSEPVAVVQQAAVVQTTQVKAINAVAIVAPAELNMEPERAEKINSLIAEAQKSIADVEKQKIVIELISSTKTGSFISSLRSQAVDWLDTPAASRSYDSPMSPKQTAWAVFMLHPSTAPNPYSIVELYPDGKVAK